MFYFRVNLPIFEFSPLGCTVYFHDILLASTCEIKGFHIEYLKPMINHCGIFSL